MKTIGRLTMLLFLSISAFLSAGAQQTGNTETIIGKWTNEDKSRIIEFVRNGATYEALIRESDDKSLIGKKQITELKFENGRYRNGKIHLIKKNKTASCTARLLDDSTLELSAKLGLMSKTQKWSRIK